MRINILDQSWSDSAGNGGTAPACIPLVATGNTRFARIFGPGIPSDSSIEARPPVMPDQNNHELVASAVGASTSADRHSRSCHQSGVDIARSTRSPNHSATTTAAERRPRLEAYSVFYLFCYSKIVGGSRHAECNLMPAILVEDVLDLGPEISFSVEESSGSGPSRKFNL